MYEIFDTEGFFDPDLHISNEEIKDKISKFLLSHKKDYVDMILVVESLAGDRFEFRSSLREIITLFGEESLDSIQVILTKGNVYTNQHRTRRLNAVTQFCVNSKISNPIEFKTDFYEMVVAADE